VVIFDKRWGKGRLERNGFVSRGSSTSVGVGVGRVLEDGKSFGWGVAAGGGGRGVLEDVCLG